MCRSDFAYGSFRTPRHQRVIGEIAVSPNPAIHTNRLYTFLAEDAVQTAPPAPEGAEVIAYCHSGSRSALATLALRSAGYDARNYAGSWHEWSRHPELPLER